MNAKQIALPLPAKRSRRVANTNVDLIGRSYEEEHSTVTVISLCANDQSRVMVRRDPDGRTFLMPAWLMRLIFMDQEGCRAA
jgi:hypothetical protein